MKNDLRTIRVAAVQMESEHGRVQANLAHATPLVEKAAKEGAQLIVLPELALTGYFLSTALWDAAETMEGHAVRWLRETAKRLRVHLGAGFAETDGRDFFNTYVLTDPDGNVAGRVRKRNAEAFNFKRVTDSTHVVETALGRIGIGICADNHYIFLPRLMQEQAVDLMLMPHAMPGAWKTSKFVKKDDIETMRTKTRNLPVLYAKLLGVPAVFVNHVGAMCKIPGILGKILDPAIFRLDGLSRIVDLDGTVLGELGSTEKDVLIADVTLDPARKAHIEPENYGGYTEPGSALLRKAIIPMDIVLGRLSYGLSGQRKRKARRITGLTGEPRNLPGGLR